MDPSCHWEYGERVGACARKSRCCEDKESLPPCVIPDALRLGIQPEVSPPLRRSETPVDGSSDGLHPSRMTIGADQKPTAYLHGGDRIRSTRPLHAASPVTTGAHKSCPPAQFERWVPAFAGKPGKGLAPGPAKAGAVKTRRASPLASSPTHCVWGSSLRSLRPHASRKNRWMDPLTGFTRRG